MVLNLCIKHSADIDPKFHQLTPERHYILLGPIIVYFTLVSMLHKGMSHCKENWKENPEKAAAKLIYESDGMYSWYWQMSNQQKLSIINIWKWEYCNSLFSNDARYGN